MIPVVSRHQWITCAGLGLLVRRACNSQEGINQFYVTGLGKVWLSKLVLADIGTVAAGN